jgi:hypothetical protein
LRDDLYFVSGFREFASKVNAILEAAAFTAEKRSKKLNL